MFEFLKKHFSVRTEFSEKSSRIEEIRNSGGGEISVTMGLHSSTSKISQDDYFLMGCDNSCSKRNFPDVSEYEREEGRWFSGANDLDGSNFGNSHGTKVGDRWIVDSFYSSLPKKKYQSSPQEVAWHYLRVRELRRQNIEKEKRISMLREESKEKPWEKMQ